MIEIVTSSVAELHEAWPDVTYKGQLFFDTFYDALNKIEPECFRHSDWRTEVYVGYIPSTDEFLVGWDCWGDDGNERCFGGCFQVLKFDGISLTIGGQSTSAPRRARQHPKDVANMSNYKGRYPFDYGVYSGPLKEMKKIFKDLKDLRLD